jgi:hypothetical protein
MDSAAQVLVLTNASTYSAYDCEFVALAKHKTPNVGFRRTIYD